ncbi:hypothetical protein CDAR_48911 [Caerostris darwini]|uniref:Uncharacterized protein n=1 Tax=Caerostris darwini TaxID=1538125 RepID=A0AAV4NLC8_9ARAC|nr:hypothetical protein CDAR_48911 [Caerostris darwini]
MSPAISTDHTFKRAPNEEWASDTKGCFWFYSREYLLIMGKEGRSWRFRGKAPLLRSLEKDCHFREDRPKTGHANENPAISTDHTFKRAPNEEWASDTQGCFSFYSREYLLIMGKEGRSWRIRGKAPLLLRSLEKDCHFREDRPKTVHANGK